MTGRIDFPVVNRAALANIEVILRRWLPDGVVRGNEFVARNPRRSDRRHGSFKVNLETGQWADFAIDARGGDLISLGAYLSGTDQITAARRIASMLNLPVND